MARDDPHFRLRIPAAMKRQVEEAAVQNKRSMNAEIIARIESSFTSPAAPRLAEADAEYVADLVAAKLARKLRGTKGVV
ncbi:Arc family DNA-binding protein [Inquilinus sp. CA228]|uniref:Arc family DNA-binding protein n=1 Tax=Inquilinus sp. CA228 TaxID=3455609 RepID=UPI003F8D1FB2